MVCGKKLLDYWCQTVLPTVFDNSLSYYENLCKLANSLSEIIETVDDNTSDIAVLKDELAKIQNWIDNFESYTNEQIYEILTNYVKVGVFFGLTDAGYFCAYYPNEWSNISFKTTGYDYSTALQSDFGHLCLLY